jgi:hypothetical protein
VQEITVEPIGLQPRQRTLASRNGAAARRVVRQDLGDEKDLVAPTRDRLGYDELGIAIHFGGVDVGHAEIDTASECRNRGLAIALVDVPGALPDHGYLLAGVAELENFHHCLASE